MKHILALAVILLIAGGSLYFVERRPRHDVVTPNAVVDATADWERDLTRVPADMTRISDNEEIRIGNELAAQYQSATAPPDPESQALARYVDQIGKRVAAQAHRTMPWQFHVVADPNLINAFALPGGHVFIGRGLLDQMTSEDELAFVLGHEIEHIDHYHAVERVQWEAQLHHVDLDVVAAIVQIPMSIWQAGYSKDEEFEADREGLRLAVAVGYSPQGALKMLERFKRLDDEYVLHAATPVDELGRVAVEGLTAYFRSHPLPSERLVQVNEIIAQDRLPADRPIKPFHLEYEITRNSASASR
ncbi:MAG TPA: M48 family metalloprotease [Acidobacteriaceae bacterium]|jgi:predicted Zn-dependent protease|nr:M48 family metalloprotease [Acidobacteriaceae bacterium]